MTGNRAERKWRVIARDSVPPAVFGRPIGCRHAVTATAIAHLKAGPCPPGHAARVASSDGCSPRDQAGRLQDVSTTEADPCGLSWTLADWGQLETALLS